MAFVPAGGEGNFTDDFDFGEEEDFGFSQPIKPNPISEEISCDRPAESWPAGPCCVQISSSQHSTVEEEMRLAVVSGTVDKVKEILDNGFNPNRILRGGWTALMYSCDNGTLNIIELLLERGANPNTHKDMFSCLMALCCTKNCEEEQLSSCAELLIKEGAKVNGHDRHRLTPLLYACQNGHTGLVNLLLSHGAEINKQDIWGWTPLCYAATQDNVELINILMSNGANPGISTHLGDTPLSIALTKELTNIAHTIEAATSPEQAVPSSCGNSVYFGDLELFLAGLQLSHLSSLFQTHQIKLSTLLSMTEQELEAIGVSQVGVRKKLLDAVVDIHKTQWKMPNEPLTIKRSLSLQEYSQVISQLSSHINYLSSSTNFVVNHTSNNIPCPIAMATEPREQQELIEQIQTVVQNSEKFYTEVKRMETQVYTELGRPLPSCKYRYSKVKIFGWTALLFGSSIIILSYVFHKSNLLYTIIKNLKETVNSIWP